MTQVGICAIAVDSNGHRYDSYHTPVELKEYIKGVTPTNIHHKYLEGEKVFVVDTSRANCTITASPTVHVSPKETRQFSCWIVKRDPTAEMEYIYSPQLELNKGEFGLVGLYYGVKRPSIAWHGFEAENFDKFMHLMQEHAPSFDLPHPEPWALQEK